MGNIPKTACIIMGIILILSVIPSGILESYLTRNIAIKLITLSEKRVLRTKDLTNGAASLLTLYSAIFFFAGKDIIAKTKNSAKEVRAR
jgi:hypothetical protein